MAVAIKALNARIRANPTLDYFCSTHFWGPASNFGIPIAAVMDTQKDPDIISGPMTAALIGYSGVFMRYSMAVTPKNYLLFGCHAVNFTAQVTQGYRFVNHWYLGGKAKSVEAQAKEGLQGVKGGANEGLAKIQGGANEGLEKVKDGANKAFVKVEELGQQAKAEVKKVIS
ncbi:hypothetical protein B0A48_07322 [Cryoendolithus antarcticus]|uniref:Mitochondrial pyruvate carrier n=1 Tax=Cryoendolithus antarcticus TaxID=1507870 RepID=A0A1V8T8A2_9PEZI|nr:hypothetical protein B0A48_07322 [Cryoendolithus antarcticus]